jgi:CRP-like cAMP-binding protein
MDTGMEIEVATTGNEGMVGLQLFLGADQTPLKTFSQVPGAALRLAAPAFRKHLKQNGNLAAVLDRFSQALMMQISQCTACNRAHSIEQRCCRWLLMTQDRVNCEDFMLTQEFLAQMLGVRRATVGEVAGELQAAKLIKYSRGSIGIFNRRGLEKRSCGCYFIIRDEYARLLNSWKK